MSLFNGRKASKKKKRKIEAAEEEWDEIEEVEESEEETDSENKISSYAASKRSGRAEDDFDDEDDEELEDDEDDEYDEDDDEDEKPRRKKKNKRFPVGGLIFMFLLIGIVLGAGYYGMAYYKQFHSMNDQYDAAHAAAAADLAAAQEEYALADPDSPANTAIRDELREDLLSDLREQVKQMENEDAELDASISEAEEKLKSLEGVEDFDYYKAIYDEYVEGREYVEELLSDH